MALTGRYCRWCDLKELRPDNIQEFNEWLAQPKGCCAPDGDGHLFVFPYGYSWQNPPNTACTGLAPTAAQESEGSTGASQ